jgi:hypothetical protein
MISFSRMRSRLNEIMKVAAFRAILGAAEKLYRDGGNERAAEELSLLAKLFVGRDTMTVATLGTRLADVATSEPGDRVSTVGGLQATLDSLLTFCEAAGAKTAAKDIKALSDALAARSAESLDVFCMQAQAWLSQPAKPKGRSKGHAKTNAANEEAVAAYVARLHDAGTDRATFEAALAKLKADKTLKSAEVAEIARRYANTVTKYKSMAAAHADIASAFTQQARFVNKVG